MAIVVQVPGTDRLSAECVRARQEAGNLEAGLCGEVSGVSWHLSHLSLKFSKILIFY